MDALVYNATGLVVEDSMEFLKGVGRMFYVINPKDNLFENKEEVPNFYVQVGCKLLLVFKKVSM